MRVQQTARFHYNKASVRENTRETQAGLMYSTLTIQELLFTLLLKVGLASSIAAFLARALTVGVILRLSSPANQFADLSLEGAFLMGLLGGRVVGPIGGAIITVPALMAH